MRLYAHYIEPVAETYAYCLLRNHFHLLVRIREHQQDGIDPACLPWRAFSNLFSTYTKTINKAYQRSGSLFEKPFHRKPIQGERYFIALVAYIHRNPQIHGFVDDFRDWPYSSYQAILSSTQTRVRRDEILDWFGDRAGFTDFHTQDPDVNLLHPWIETMD